MKGGEPPSPPCLTQNVTQNLGTISWMRMSLPARAGDEFQNGAHRGSSCREHENQSLYVNRFSSSENLPRTYCVIGIVSISDLSQCFIYLVTTIAERSVWRIEMLGDKLFPYLTPKLCRCFSFHFSFFQRISLLDL